MNAADQARVTPFLIAACVVAGAVLVAMLAGVGASVHWRAATSARRSAAMSASARPHSARSQPLDAYAQVWQRPLFNQKRQPAPSSGNDNGQRVSLGDLELTGIILTPGLHMALMHNRKSDHDIRVREGDAVPNGNWVLHELKPRQAVFVDGGKHTTLALKVTAGHNGVSVRSGQSGPAAHRRSTGHASPYRHPAGSHSQLIMRSARPAPATSNDDKAAAQREARMQAIKARIKEARRQQRAQRNKDQDGSSP